MIAFWRKAEPEVSAQELLDQTETLTWLLSELITLRQESNLTLEQLADRSTLASRRLQEIEGGAKPTGAELDDLLKCYGVNHAFWTRMSRQRAGITHIDKISPSRLSLHKQMLTMRRKESESKEGGQPSGSTDFAPAREQDWEGLRATRAEHISSATGLESAPVGKSPPSNSEYTVNSDLKRPVAPSLPSVTFSVFISYRRSDEPSVAGRLYDRLEKEFGREHVFMDVDSIELGLDFADALDSALDSCKVLIAIIGARWLSATDDQGRRRLDDPEDYVRLELEAALRRNIRLVPLLVDGTLMPTSKDLPGSLSSLARRNGREVSHARFGSDITALIATLRESLTPR